MTLSLLALWIGAALAADAPEISRSVGVEGGVVVLWPRVIPRSDSATTRAAAFVVQRELARLAAEVLPGRAIDVRPEPERVCPQQGCATWTVGAVLVHQGDACVVVATVSGPGRSAATLVPWAGAVDLKGASVPFREPPESLLSIRDFQACNALGAPLAAGGAAVGQALAALAGVPAPVPAVAPVTAVATPPPPVQAVPTPQPSQVPNPKPETVEGW